MITRGRLYQRARVRSGAVPTNFVIRLELDPFGRASIDYLFDDVPPTPIADVDIAATLKDAGERWATIHPDYRDAIQREADYLRSELDV